VSFSVWSIAQLYDIAPFVVFLASGNSDWVKGETLLASRKRLMHRLVPDSAVCLRSGVNGRIVG